MRRHDLTPTKDVRSCRQTGLGERQAGSVRCVAPVPNACFDAPTPNGVHAEASAAGRSQPRRRRPQAAREL